MRNSIKIKSSIFLAILLIVTVFLLGLLILKGIKEDQEMRQEAYLHEQSKIANVYVEQVILSDPSYQDDYDQDHRILNKKGSQIAMQLGTITGMHVVLYDSRGKIIGNSFFSTPTTTDKKLLYYALNNKIAYKTDGDTLYYVAPLNNGQDGAVQFGYSLQESQYFYNKIQSLFFQIGALVVILSFLIAYFYFYQITNGILRLKEATEKIEQGNYRSIVPLKRSDELGKLSQGIYSMSHQIEENVITMQKEQHKLNLAVDKLQKLEMQQKTFIGNITHEFKTPLSIILAYMDLLEMYKDDPALVEDARDNVKKEAQRLYDMVEKVLHLASFERYDFELQREKLESKEILQELCDRMKGKAQKFDVSISVHLQQASIWIDKESFYLIFINLLDNAIKYNVPRGTISLTSEVDKGVVMLQIKDNGIGIPPDAMEKIFEPFYTVSKDRSQLSGGTGLGLALVKQLVEKQQGTISLNSVNGQGTEVSLSFPLYIEKY
jgi:two-component system phosphate regulon sensor histidine kinase PhoR